MQSPAGSRDAERFPGLSACPGPQHWLTPPPQSWGVHCGHDPVAGESTPALSPSVLQTVQPLAPTAPCLSLSSPRHGFALTLRTVASLQAKRGGRHRLRTRNLEPCKGTRALGGAPVTPSDLVGSAEMQLVMFMLRVSVCPPPLPTSGFMTKDPFMRLQSLVPPVSGKAAGKRTSLVSCTGLAVDVLRPDRDVGRESRIIFSLPHLCFP